MDYNSSIGKKQALLEYFLLHYRNVHYYIVNQDFPVIFASEIKYGTL